MNLFLQPLLKSGVRHLLTFVAGVLAAHNVAAIFQGDTLTVTLDVQQVVSFVGLALAAAWTWVEKMKQARLTHTALLSSPHTPLADVVAEVQSGGGVKLSKLGVPVAVLLAVLLVPAVVSAQTMTKPAAPPAIENCVGTPDWQWNATASRWDPVCVTIPPQPIPMTPPDMGPFCGRASWEWDEEAGRLVPVCVKKSKLYQAILTGGIAATGISTAQGLTDLATGQVGTVDPLLKPWSSTPWLAGAVQAGITAGTMFLSDDWFRRHPTLSGAIQVAMLAYRSGSVAYLALKMR